MLSALSCFPAIKAEGCRYRQHGCLWASLWKCLGWLWVGHCCLPMHERVEKTVLSHGTTNVAFSTHMPPPTGKYGCQPTVENISCEQCIREWFLTPLVFYIYVTSGIANSFYTRLDTFHATKCDTSCIFDLGLVVWSTFSILCLADECIAGTLWVPT